ncbi:MAG: 16S rRNA (guanine(966)-N(2))-methyltransferase RsmD [Myxococcales bacterium]|nr:16S rRNA (guanine(966)-N(2))-methyltransferase RsmD [Myxococcales bacterium]
MADVQRIVAGRLRGRKLLPLPGAAPVRPTGAKVREAIFSRLFDQVRGARVLDLFAGSGALAFEAISRGAAAATLVDRDPAVIRHLRAQAGVFGVEAEVTLVNADALAFLGKAAAGGRFDLVFVDPPYAEVELLARVLTALADERWLAAEAVVVVERARGRQGSAALSLPIGLRAEQSRDYGQTSVDFLRAAPPSR